MVEQLTEESKMTKSSDKTSTPFDESEYSVAVAQLARYGDAIGKEFTLVSDRMTWMVVSESFIFSAFATSAAYYAASGAMQFLVGVLLVLMPLLGIFLAFIVIPAINAAHEAVVILKTKRQEYENQLPEHLRVRTISCDDPQHEKGNQPAKVVPAVIIVFWVVLLAVALLELCKA